MTFFVHLRRAHDLQTIVPAFWDLQLLLYLRSIYGLQIWNEYNFFPDVLFCIFVGLQHHKTRVPDTVLLIMVDSKTLRQYQCILASFMLFVHNHPVGSEYSPDHVLATEVLAAITPNDVLRYMTLRNFGTTEPARDANPTSARANTLAMDKKQFLFLCRIAIHGVWQELKETLPVVRWWIPSSSVWRRRKRGNKGWIRKLSVPCLVRNLL